MSTLQLLTRSLTYHWRTNVVVVVGVAIAVAVLAGALLVGDSVRQSLRELFSQRLGKTDHVVTSTGFFREQLASDLATAPQFAAGGFAASSPLIALRGTAINDQNRRRAGDVAIFAVDERFWQFHNPGGTSLRTPQNRDALISESLAREIGLNDGGALLLVLGQPSAIPVESLHGRKDDVGRTIRLDARGVVPDGSLGNFSLQTHQGAAHNVFVSLRFLQKELSQENKVNTILTSAAPTTGSTKTDELERAIQERATLEDAGLYLRPIAPQNSLSFETESKIVNDQVSDIAVEVANESWLQTTKVFSYLANSINSGERTTPYSLVTAIDESSFNKLAELDSQILKDPSSDQPPIILNEWAAKDLGATRGDKVRLEYYLWLENGQLETRTTEFRLQGVVPITGLAAIKDLVPEYPGITESENLADWDPPFPIDLSKVRKQDEDYWHQYRTTPKAFIPLSVGQQLWQSRYGKVTSILITNPTGELWKENTETFVANLRKDLSPTAMGFQVIPVRAEGLQASRGATDFGEYFLYFSFFLVVSALLLTALFFKLGIEQRLREIGTLQAIGFPAARIRRLFLSEGAALSIFGSLLGLAGAVAYGALIMYGLRTWWVDAVGTTSLRLHVSWASLVIGGLGGVVAAVFCIILTLRRVGRESTRSLLTQTLSGDGGNTPQGKKRFISRFKIAVTFTVLGLLLLIATGIQLIPPVAGFFGAGLTLLIACLCYLSVWLRRGNKKPIYGTGFWSLYQLGFRNATYRPSRSVLCITLIASAAFIIVAVDAFRLSGGDVRDKKSGTGGFPLLAESQVPIVHNPNSTEGREALNLQSTDTNFSRFRVRPGDDTSCLNLYQPRNPRIIAPTDDFLLSNRFAFQKSMAISDEEKANPWLLLKRDFPDGAIPVISDATSLTYVLHLAVGDDFVVQQGTSPLRLRIVGALSHSLFQSEFVMAEQNFVRLFPSLQGYRLFLIETAKPSAEVATMLEDRLSHYGFDAVSTAERLENFYRVENTYLSTFQMLGGLGLLLGTFGMAAILLRNVFERRKELALLRAVGYNSSHFSVMVIAENILMLGFGLAVGFICALLSIAPVFLERGGQLPNISLGLLLLAVLLSGTIASLVATLAALRSPLLPALRAE